MVPQPYYLLKLIFVLFSGREQLSCVPSNGVRVASFALLQPPILLRQAEFHGHLLSAPCGECSQRRCALKWEAGNEDAQHRWLRFLEVTINFLRQSL